MADLITTLANQVAAKTSLTLGTDLFTAPEEPADEIVPINAAFMYESDGYWIPVPYMGSKGNVNKKTFDQAHLYIKLRRKPREYTAGRVLFDQIIAALDLFEPAVTPDDISKFLWCKATKPKPTFKGRNKDKQFIWELKFELGYERLITSNNP
jgi:hypothetical protein